MAIGQEANRHLMTADRHQKQESIKKEFKSLRIKR